MKKLKYLLPFILLISIVFVSCNEDDENSNEELLEIAFEKIRFKGASIIIEINGEMCLAIMNSPEEAMSYGFNEKSAYEMFATGYDPCTEEFSIFGTVSCDGDDECEGECVLKRWDSNTKSWINHGASSAPAFGNTWNCFCE